MSDYEVNVQGDESLGRTESGIIVPKELALKNEAWLRDEFKRFERLYRLWAKRGVDMMLVCSKCQEKNKSGIIEFTQDEVGRPVLTCNCTERVVRI